MSRKLQNILQLLEEQGWPERSVVRGAVYYGRTNNGLKPHIYCWGGEWVCYLWGNTFAIGKTMAEACDQYLRSTIPKRGCPVVNP